MDELLSDLLALRGSVMAASDEFFADKENLIKPAAPVFTPETFGAKGQIYDGWETRRRRGPGHDWVIARFGVPGVIHAVAVDTTFFAGNYPQECSAEACSATGYPAPGELEGWQEIVPRSPLAGDNRLVFPVASRRRFSHIRLNIFPDGGIARLRVLGQAVPDPALLDGLTVDLAALENGADVVACSDQFYSSPRNAISPGLSRVMGEGWETRRRRAPGNEWLVVRLTGQGIIRLAEIDTSGYRGNAPEGASLQQADGPFTAETAWRDLLPRARLQPDTVHRFRLDGAPATHVRLSIFPDGGIARLRLYGSLTDDGLAAVSGRWDETS